MTTHKFQFMGANRSLAESFDGYGYIATIFIILVAALLWTFSNIVSVGSRRIVFIWGVSMLFLTIDEFLFFFPFAAILSLISAILTATAGSLNSAG